MYLNAEAGQTCKTKMLKQVVIVQSCVIVANFYFLVLFCCVLQWFS